MLKDPSAFKLFATDAFSLCFTATPDGKDAKGVERKVVTAFEFQRFNYFLDDADASEGLSQDRRDSSVNPSSFWFSINFFMEP